MSKKLKIEAGKYYSMRNGDRVYVVATNKPGTHSVIGWSDNGQIRAWLPTGQFLADSSTGGDIISEWKELERIPWEHLPKWCKWWAKDRDGSEFGYRNHPFCSDFEWRSSKPGNEICLPNDLRSNYTGDWSQSLRERPEGV